MKIIVFSQKTKNVNFLQMKWSYSIGTACSKYIWELSSWRMWSGCYIWSCQKVEWQKPTIFTILENSFISNFQEKSRKFHILVLVTLDCRGVTTYMYVHVKALNQLYRLVCVSKLLDHSNDWKFKFFILIWTFCAIF